MSQKIVLPKAEALLFPVPTALISCRDAQGRPNIITLAWVGVASSQPPTLSLGIRANRFSYGIIKESGEFVVNLPGAELVEAADLCGTVSGRTTDKFASFNLTEQAAIAVKAPLIAECPVNVECRLKQIIPIGTHDLFLGEVLHIHVAEELLVNGKIEFQRLRPLAYLSGAYHAVGEEIGRMGFAVKKKTSPSQADI